MKLNLGAGDKPIKGYENWDRKTGQECYPLKAENESCEEIRASHVLEHISHQRTLEVLKDWVRALKIGGTLKIAVPDFDIIIRCILAKADVPIEGWLMGGQKDSDDFHAAIFNEVKLSTLMEMAGLRDIKRWKSETDDCASFDVSLNLQGTKWN